MKNILIIDDEGTILDVLRRFLEKCGYSVSTANTWEIGFEFLDSHDFDLVMLDVNMPGKDGFQISKEIRESRPNQKIIIMTGLQAGSVYDFYNMSDADFDDIVYKPFSFEKIKTIVGQVIES